jgi:hypothetical protein
MAETHLFAELPARAQTRQRLPRGLLAAMLCAIALAPAITLLERGPALLAAALTSLALVGFALALAARLPFAAPLPALAPVAALFSLAAAWAGFQGWMPLESGAEAISSNAGAAKRALVTAASAASAYWLALQLGWEGERARRIARTLVAGAALWATLGLAGLTAPEPLLAAVGLVTAVALLFDGIGGDEGSRGLRHAFIHIVQSLATEAAGFVLAVFLLLGSIIVLDSALGQAGAALVALVCALALAPSLAIARRRRTLVLCGLLLAVAVALIVAAAIQTLGEESRHAQAAVFAVMERPLTGHGLGAAPATLPAAFDLAVAFGLPCLLLGGALVLYLAGILIYGARRRRRMAALPCAGLAVCAALAFGAGPSLAGLAAAASLLGVATAQAFPRSR